MSVAAIAPASAPRQSFFADLSDQPFANEFVQMPRVVSASTAMTQNQKIALTYVLHCHHMGHPERATVKKLMEFCNMARNTAYTAVKFLVNAGLLAREHMEGVAYAFVLRPVNEAADLLDTLRKGVRKVASKARKTTRAARVTAHSLVADLKGRKQLKKLVDMSLKRPSDSDMAEVERAWGWITEQFKPEQVIRAYETYAAGFDAGSVKYARRLADWLRDKPAIEKMLSSERDSARTTCRFSARNQQTRDIALSSKAPFYPDVELALEAHRRAWRWLPVARRANGFAGRDDVSGLLELVRAGGVDGVDMGMLREALEAEVRVRELFKEHCSFGLTGLVPEEKLACSSYGVTGLRIEA